MMSHPEVAWNLTELCSCATDPKIERTLAEAKTTANSFERKYKNRIGTLSPTELLECFREIEDFDLKLSDVSLYAGLSFAANMTLPETQSLNDRVEKAETQISKQLAFYSLDLGKLLQSSPEIIKDPALTNYRHMLERTLKRVEHQLSEVEEQIIIEKDQFGIHGWEELQSKWLNTRKFQTTVLGEKKTLSYGEANGLLSHPDRNTRKATYRSIYELLGNDGEIFASALRAICNDWVTTSKRRKYTTPMESSLISNDTDLGIIENLLKTVEEQAKIYRYYLQQKAKLMDLPILSNYDIVAPLQNTAELKFTYQQAQEKVTKAYKAFNTQYAKPVEEMFKKQHIDATPRYGKRNGAFCACYYGGKSAFILQSFTGTLTDVFTLAHELGHATHDWYSSRKQTLMNMYVPSVVAETASIFGELLLTDLLLKEAKSDNQRRAILCLVLDEAGLTTFQVTARVWFEQSLYAAVEQGQYLDYQTICNLWVKARDRIYQKAVDWLPEMEAEWTMKPHYYMANYRFYNYPYVYAQMFVYSLYERYLQEGSALFPKMEKALSAGGSISPVEIGKILGLNVEAPNFWTNGGKIFKRFVDDLEKTI
jgi:oligoendopeptidase F